MPRTPRRRLTYANVMSTLAVFIALGGSSYAAATINGSAIENRSISAPKIKRNTLSGLEIRERSLARVPRAGVADNATQFGGLIPSDLVAACPVDTIAAADVCIERTPRPAMPYGSAVHTCRSAMGSQGFGRRLPTHGELQSAFTFHPLELAAGGELTSELIPSAGHPSELDVLFMTNEAGRIAVTTNRSEGAKAFRCVTDPHRP